MLERILTSPLRAVAVLFLVGLLLALVLVNAGSSLDPAAKGKGKDVTVGVVEKGKG